MSPKNLALLLMLGMASGCMMESRQTPLPSSSPYIESRRQDLEPAARKDWIQNAPELGEDLKQRVLKGEMQMAEAKRIESERRKEQAGAVQRELDRIKKEAREDYAATRPEQIKAALLKEEICLGMIDKDVLVCLGEPQRKSRTVTQRGTRERWIYNKMSVWFDNGLVTGWHAEQ